MNIIVIKEKLKEVLSSAIRATTENINIPVLKNFLFEADSSGIKLKTTDLEMGITIDVPGKVIKEGSITVPSNLLIQVINNIQTERLNLIVKDGSLEINTDNYNAKIQGSAAEEFPIIPKIKNPSEYIEIESDEFIESINKVSAAAQFSELRPELNTILFRFSGEEIILASTDSFRLAEKRIKEKNFSTNFSSEFQFLIPLKTANEYTRIFKKKEKIKIFKDENQILIKGSSSECISRLVDGNFPDYSRIIPKDFDLTFLVNREELIGAVKLTGVLSSAVHEITIELLKDDKAIEIFSGEKGIGENKYILPIKKESKKGDIKNISFNWKYLSDGIKTFDSEDLFIGLNEENGPAIIRPPKQADHFYILMPVIKK